MRLALRHLQCRARIALRCCAQAGRTGRQHVRRSCRARFLSCSACSFTAAAGPAPATGLVIANDADGRRCNLLTHQTKRMCRWALAGQACMRAAAAAAAVRDPRARLPPGVAQRRRSAGIPTVGSPARACTDPPPLAIHLLSPPLPSPFSQPQPDCDQPRGAGVPAAAQPAAGEQGAREARAVRPHPL